MSVPEEQPLKESGEKESGSKKPENRKKLASAAKQALPGPQASQLKMIAADEMTSLREQLRQEQEKSNEYLNKLLYAQADFENYRRRLNQDVESRIEAGKAGLIRSFLSVVDELELALNAAKNSEGAEAIANGLEIVLKKFRDLLSSEGLAPIETMGKKFDPAFHEAAERLQCGDKEEGTILEEVRKGFTLKGKLIRPSIVKIAVPHIAESQTPRPAEGEKS